MEVDKDNTTKKTKQQEVYKRLKTLGQGTSGVANLVQCLSDQSYAVIKQVDISHMNDEERR